MRFFEGENIENKMDDSDLIRSWIYQKCRGMFENSKIQSYSNPELGNGI